MTDHTVNITDNDPENELDLNDLRFKTASFIQNDLLISLIFLGLILFFPLVVWDHIDHYLVFTWQGCMVAIVATRWICRYTYTNAIDEKSLNGFWSGALIFLTLLDGLGWGIAGALLFPADSTLTMCIIALLLIGVGSVGAVSYSARMMIAIPYLLCAVLPYTARLYMSGGNDEFLIGSALSLLTMLFCFAADRVHLTLESALDISSEDEEIILNLEDENQRLHKITERERNRSKSLEDQISHNSQELEELHNIITHYSDELHILAGKSINLVNDLGSLKQTDLNQNQNELITKIEQNARHLSDNLNSSDEDDHKQISIIESDTKSTESETEITETLRVLIVDDDKNECKKIESCLRDLSLVYKSVENVPAALAVLCEAEAENLHFDIVIAKMWMPEMDGIGFAECLQDDPEFSDIKIIMINSGEMPSERRLQKAGIDWVIQKPLISEDLINGINHVTENNTSSLPASIEALVDDAIRVSINYSEDDDQNNLPPSIIDQYVIEGLRSSTTSNFIEVINDFLEEAPLLIEETKIAYDEKRYSEIVKPVRELGSRSTHMGAIGLVESAKAIEETILNHGTERVMGMIQSIEAEFIQVESALLAELSNGVVLANELKH